MEISDVRIKLLTDGGESDRLRAFCSITFDECFVVHDLKIIEGSQGIFVAMPSRRIAERCPRCQTKNHNQARYCNNCGSGLRVKASAARTHAFVDIAHPINSDFRKEVHDRVTREYERAVAKAKNKGVSGTGDLSFEERFRVASGGSSGDSFQHRKGSIRPVDYSESRLIDMRFLAPRDRCPGGLPSSAPKDDRGNEL